MRGRSGLLVFLAIAVVFGCANSVFAQGVATAQLNGTVTDPSGGAVSGATIDLRNVATNTTSTATTNDSGYYVFASVPPGTYDLKYYRHRLLQVRPVRNCVVRRPDRERGMSL